MGRQVCLTMPILIFSKTTNTETVGVA